MVRLTSPEFGESRTTGEASSLCLPVFQQLGEAPVQDDHFTVISQDYILAFQIAVNDAPRVGIGHGVANRDEDVQQRYKLERVGVAAVMLFVIVPDRLAQGAAFDPAHRVERLVAVRSAHSS